MEPPVEHRIDPAIAGEVPAEPDSRLPRQRPRGWGAFTWLLVVVMLGCIAAVIVFWLKQEPAPLPPAAPAQPPPPVAAAPEIRHPIEEARGGEPYKDAKPLPALAVSDAAMQNTLADLFGAATFDNIFYPDQIVHRFVATIDNLPRKTVPPRYMPVKPAQGPLITAGKDESMSIGADNAARYAPYIRMADAIDARKLVATYVYFYPLMQEDYRNLGYPKGYFNDRLIEAIDDMLAAPEAPATVALVQPKVLYQYADPDLEARSAGQKIMMRMGSENAAKVKAKLQEIRRELTSRQKTDATK
jgi:hypothetical protein